MGEVRGFSINSGPVEMKGSAKWNLYHIYENDIDDVNEDDDNAEAKDESMYICTIDLRLAPGGTLIGTAFDRSDNNNDVSDIVGKWNDKTIEFALQLRDEDEKTAFYKGIWSEDHEAISGTAVLHHSWDELETKFEMKLQDKENVEDIRSKHSQTFCENMAKYCKNSPDKMFYDFLLLSNDGEEIPAHKFILGSQSQYFEALFRKENGNEVELDYPGNAIRSSIDFLYTRELNITVDNAQDILTFSNYACFKDLEEMSSAFIIKNMDISNVIDILRLSEVLAIEALRNASVNYIAMNFNNFFKSKDDFLLIQKDLFREIVWSKNLTLYTDKGTIISGVDREFDVLEKIQTYVDAHDIKDEVVAEDQLWPPPSNAFWFPPGANKC